MKWRLMRRGMIVMTVRPLSHYVGIQMRSNCLVWGYKIYVSKRMNTCHFKAKMRDQ